MKILIADDDPQIIRALRITLGARGYESVTAENGAEAVNQAITQHPDLVMLDLGMPRLAGIEALDAGADDYVTKPFSIEGIRLTPTGWRILELLIQNAGRIVAREVMLTQVWGPNHTRDTGYLRLYLAQLRKKLEPVPSRPRYLITELGMGYRFVPDRESE